MIQLWIHSIRVLHHIRKPNIQLEPYTTLVECLVLLFVSSL